MAICEICGEPLPAGARSCSVCGTSVRELMPTGTIVIPPRQEKTELVVPPSVPARSRYCPVCQAIYGPDYDDAFCVCGIELVLPIQPVSTNKPLNLPPAVKPPTGTACLSLVGVDKQIVQYFPLTKDATLVGRLDAVAGIFPDIDLDTWLDSSLTRRISRQHALILRNRARNNFNLRPLAGNTGTQLEADMVIAMHDYPLQTGNRIILGGVVKLRFESI